MSYGSYNTQSEAVHNLLRAFSLRGDSTFIISWFRSENGSVSESEERSVLCFSTAGGNRWKSLCVQWRESHSSWERSGEVHCETFVRALLLVLNILILFSPAFHEGS